MWVDKYDEPIPTYGNDGGEFLLMLYFKKQYFGRENKNENLIVTAYWSSLNECFYEKETDLEIYDGDIYQWWKE